MYHKKSHLHFVGIGGIGMSGIAKILRCQGYTISGCDIDLDKKSVKELQDLGCTVHKDNNTAACHDTSINILVYSSAIQASNPEIIAARQRGIPTIPRALMLAELMRTKFSIAIAGSHGKTTTTSLIAHILLEAKKDPTVIIGGHLMALSTNARFGLGDFLVAEADESDRSLVQLHATLAIITNIGLEHLDTYTDIDDIKNTFKQFINNLPFYGAAIVCTDNAEVRSLLPLPHIKTITYGIEGTPNVQARNVKLLPAHSTFELLMNKQEMGEVTIAVPGAHNVQNGLASIALANELEIPLQTITQALASFKGVDRRFSYKGVYKDAEIFDDYGHHPDEIKNALLVAKNRTKAKVHVVFQPHRYSRTDKLWAQFVSMFLASKIDSLIITDIYPASEAPIANITGHRLAQAIQERNPTFPVHYAPFEDSFAAIKAQLDSHIGKDDLILVQGAGKIVQLVQKLV